MDFNQALEVIEALSEGIDPESGELLGNDSCFNNPRVIRALFAAKEALNNSISAAKRKSQLPEKSGSPWHPEEDRRLSESFDSGLTVEQLANKHGRTAGAIAARLVRIGKISERNDMLSKKES